MDCFACARNDGLEMPPFPTVIARLDRAIQYSRDAGDRTERPRRTGYPACAGYDGCWWRRAPDFALIALARWYAPIIKTACSEISNLSARIARAVRPPW